MTYCLNLLFQAKKKKQKLKKQKLSTIEPSDVLLFEENEQSNSQVEASVREVCVYTNFELSHDTN